MVREPSTAWVPCCTKPISKVRLWIWVAQASNEQEQLVEAE